jgi:hypothetical protein
MGTSTRALPLPMCELAGHTSGPFSSSSAGLHAATPRPLVANPRLRGYASSTPVSTGGRRSVQAGLKLAVIVVGAPSRSGVDAAVMLAVGCAYAALAW